MECNILIPWFPLYILGFLREFVMVASPPTLILSSFVTLTFQETWYKSMKWAAETSFKSPHSILWDFWSVTSILLPKQVWVRELILIPAKFYFHEALRYASLICFPTPILAAVVCLRRPDLERSLKIEGECDTSPPYTGTSSPTHMYSGRW